ncbi:uncharacterized protein LOC107609411 isoform X2 [Arachis ipaensis]|uniref:uncharacterized protein LOC107609411 isoform X2 n=1 Tax=Arachis ipaensis TaxID=130454 RepID=UPI000A2B607A|nr:uncharacterized protein LOC107609411 isoform X2 [Arachis ipaensis]
MMWEWEELDDAVPQNDQPDTDSYLNFDLFSALSKPKDYYKILEVDYDATDDAIRSNYIRLALKWHPDKQKDQGAATTRFQEINEAYQVNSAGFLLNTIVLSEILCEGSETSNLF